MTNKELAAYVRDIANNTLYAGYGDRVASFYHTYSCDALFSSWRSFSLPAQAREDLRNKLRSLEPGLADHMRAFNEFPEGLKRQGARYLWLMWFALMIEEEGVI